MDNSEAHKTYAELVENAAASLLGLVTFAILENERAKHKQGIAAWYGGKSREDLARAKHDAEERLRNFAQKSAAKVSQRVAEGETRVVKEIRKARRFWPQFGLNLAANLAFAILLALIALLVYLDPSPVELAKNWLAR